MKIDSLFNDREKQLLKEIDIDGILDSYYLQDYLEEKPNSIFKQIGFTEKPDILAGKMLEGRVGILVDGSPIALTLPFLLIEDLQSSEDYYEENNKVSFQSEVIKTDNVYKFKDESTSDTFIELDDCLRGKAISKVAKENGANLSVKKFVRFETGEGIEKKVDDFAAEVAAQAGL